MIWREAMLSTQMIQDLNLSVEPLSVAVNPMWMLHIIFKKLWSKRWRISEFEPEIIGEMGP